MSRRAADLHAAVERILEARRLVPEGRAVLAALSGIDGSGKGYVAARIAAALEAGGLRAAVINVDGWLNLPHLRFDPWRPAEHFYRHALRFEEMFARLVLPLRDSRSVRLVAGHVEETATARRPRLYAYDDVDVVLLEGIFLLKEEFRALYDVALWVDCSFETALERAVARGQEGLPPGATIAAYRTIYFPAQRIHLTRDEPRTRADLVIANDPRSARRECAPDRNPGESARIEWGAGPDSAGPPGCCATVGAWNEGERGALR